MSHDSIRGCVRPSVGLLVRPLVCNAFVSAGRDEPGNDLFRVYELVLSIKAARELAEVKEKLRSKNQELKSIIDDTRTTIWEINSMLGMRKLGS